LKLLSRIFPRSWIRRGLPQQFACVVAAAAVVTLSACSGSPAKNTSPAAADPTAQPEDVIPVRPKVKNSNDSLLGDLFDASSNWTEQQVTALPALPQPGNLLPFDVSQRSQLNFSVDGKSLSVGQDGVVRLTVVITSPQGAHNVYYEGIRCANFEWRLYAAANEDGTKWDRGVENDWSRMEQGGANAYQSTLYNDYLCQNKAPAGRSAAQIVDNIKYHRAGFQMPH
jgi:CNP1-like family